MASRARQGDPARPPHAVASSLQGPASPTILCPGRRVTLQIVCAQVEGELRIELHGRLSRPEVAEFQRSCLGDQPTAAHRVENLSGASADGILALREQRARGARLDGASPYIELLLRAHRGAGGTT